MPKAHSVIVTITSTSNGAVNQEVRFEEFASTPEELVQKHFAISAHVVGAVNAACAELAAPFTAKGKK